MASRAVSASALVALAMVSGLATPSTVLASGAARHPSTWQPRAGVTELAVALVREAPDEPTAIAADSDGVVVVGRSGAAFAYAPDGREQWRIDPEGDVGSRLHPIALGEGLVVVPVFDPPVGSGVLALERSTGRTRWEVSVAEPRSVAVGPAPDGSTVVAVVERSGAVTLLRADDGTAVTQVPLGFGHLLGVPHVWVRDGRVIVAWAHDDAAEIRVLDGGTGEIHWAWSGPGLGAAPAVGHDRLILVENTEIDGDVVHAEARGLDLATGAVQWSTPVDGAFLPTAPVALSGGRALVVDLDGMLIALDARTGQVRWRRATRLVQIEAAPLLTRSVAAMTTYGTGLVALSARTGMPIRNQVPGPVQTVVTIEDSTAAAGSLLLLVRHRAGEGEIWWLRPS
ncbi:MAG TPA: PQQ-binding-like beta-propeller repeat protein [Acidimicrobiia bacterium]|nr:PQQ-binding-like beta-propeller repeat protein [Acidimicrobiia bacterium]